MGQNPHGIFMCAVVDVMHTIQHGIITYVLDCFKKCPSVQSLAMLDKMAYIFDTTCCQSICTLRTQSMTIRSRSE
jgi:hypothetical protein